MEYYSFETTPQMKLIDAIRISISIPFIFTPVINNKGEYVIDGAVYNPYPIQYYRNIDKKIGICLTNEYMDTNGCGDNTDIVYHCCNIQQFLFSLINSCCNKYLERMCHKFKDDTIFIRENNAASFDFGIAKKYKHEMFRNGYKTAKKYFRHSGVKKR